MNVKAIAGVGSAYLASLQAYISGSCRAEMVGGLKFGGQFGYDEATQKVDASRLKSSYYANAQFLAKIKGGIRVQALYFLKKELYQMTLGEWNLGEGGLEGAISIDAAGKLQLASPVRSGVMAGKIDENGSGPKAEIVDVAKAETLLRDAAQQIDGSGEERQRIVLEVKIQYEKAIKTAEGIIHKERKKSDKCLEKLVELEVKVSRYHKLLDKYSGSHTADQSRSSEAKAASAGSPGKSGEKSKKPQGTLDKFVAKATALRDTAKDKFKTKLITALMKAGIRDLSDFTARVNKLSDLKIKISKKQEMHLKQLKAAIEAQQKSSAVLQDVEAAIRDVQALEKGKGVDKISVMEKNQQVLQVAEQKLAVESKTFDLEAFEQQIVAVDQVIKAVEKDVAEAEAS